MPFLSEIGSVVAWKDLDFTTAAYIKTNSNQIKPHVLELNVTSDHFEQKVCQSQCGIFFYFTLKSRKKRQIKLKFNN